MPAEDYPLGTLCAYGPNNRVATKLAAAILNGPSDKDPDPVLHRWITANGDARNDPAISAEIREFFASHGITRLSTPDRIIGCPHEEGKDYPEGESCPHCLFWQDHERFPADLEPLECSLMSPQDILDALSSDHDTSPRQALASAEFYRPELFDPLLQSLEAGIANPVDLPEGEASLFSYAVYLLAKWRLVSAHEPIVRWLSLPGEGPFDIGGDIVTQDGGRILAMTCGGNLDLIKGLVQNRDANEYCRSAALDALATLVALEETPREPIAEYFHWLATEGLERQPDYVWTGFACSCMDLEMIEMFPELRRAYKEGLIEEDIFTLEELDERESAPRGEEIAWFRDSHQPIHNVTKATAWWGNFEKERTARTEQLSRSAFESAMVANSYFDDGLEWREPSEPYRADPKIGRNEPCPCGSGKKYKKCCGR